jgi:hypothetical protein
MAHQGFSMLADAMADDDAAGPEFVQAVHAGRARCRRQAPRIRASAHGPVPHLFARAKVAELCRTNRKLRAGSRRARRDGRAVADADMGIPGAIYALLQNGQQDRAVTTLRSLIAAMDAVVPADDEERLNVLYFTGNVYRMIGPPRDALRMFQLTSTRALPAATPETRPASMCWSARCTR